MENPRPKIAYSLDVFVHSATSACGTSEGPSVGGSNEAVVGAGAAIIALRFLDLPPIVLESSGGKRVGHGFVPFGMGKSAIFSASSRWLRSRLGATPLYVLLFERNGGGEEPASARLVGSTSLSLFSLFPASTEAHADDVRRGFRTGRYALYDAMGRHSATVVLALRLACLGADVCRYLAAEAGGRDVADEKRRKKKRKQTAVMLENEGAASDSTTKDKMFKQTRFSRSSDGFYSGNGGSIAFASEEKGGGKGDEREEWEQQDEEEEEEKEDPSVRDAIEFAISFTDAQRHSRSTPAGGETGQAGSGADAVVAPSSSSSRAAGASNASGSGRGRGEEEMTTARPASSAPEQVFASSLYYAPPALAFTNTGFEEAAAAAAADSAAAVPMVAVKSMPAKAAPSSSSPPPQPPPKAKLSSKPARAKRDMAPAAAASESERILLMQAGAMAEGTAAGVKEKQEANAKQGKKKSSTRQLRQRLPPWARRSSPSRRRSTRAQMRQRLARIVAQPDPLAETSPARSATGAGQSRGDSFESRLLQQQEQGDDALRRRRLALIWSEKMDPIHAWAEEGEEGAQLSDRGEIENDRYGKGS